jgi:endoribonuclease Dicer
MDQDIEDLHSADSSSSDDDEFQEILTTPDSAAKQASRKQLFREWIAENTEQLDKSHKKDRIATESEEMTSIADLLAKQDSVVIDDPRDYQLELFEMAKEQNIIAVLPTGSGKTMISILLLQHILDQEVEYQAAGRPPRIAYFLVEKTTLVFQQFNVLKCNLDHKIVQICGSMGCDTWKKETWAKKLKGAMVVVCTADILFDCLFHKFFSMEQINLLIFDEAHHAKSNHPYARIMREFFETEPDICKRPRVFSMTASPVDAKADIHHAATQLETILKSRIVTVPLSEAYQNKAQDVILTYERLPAPYETDLHKRLQEMLQSADVGGWPLWRVSKDLAATVGRWGADVFWSLALADEQATQVETRAEKNNRNRGVAKLNEDMASIKGALHFVAQQPIPDPKVSEADLSPKVMSLYRFLKEHFSLPTDCRCIIFVEQRIVAKILHHIFCKIGGQHLRPSYLTGSSSKDEAKERLTFRQQLITLSKFRSGDINCLFATSVAEEGLDIPYCNLVIRFDLYKTGISYIQSKGRARQKNSKFVDMMEQNNMRQVQLRAAAQDAARRMVDWCARDLADRAIASLDDIPPRFDLDEHPISDSRTGAKVSLSSSLAVLAHFTDMLPGATTGEKPRYVIYPRRREYVCEVILPDNSPVGKCMGKPGRSKGIARRRAALAMVGILHQREYLNEHFLPIYQREISLMRNAKLALNSKKQSHYDMRVKPSAWNDQGIPAAVYLTVIDVDRSLDRPHQPLGLLTRAPLPHFPRFPLFLANGSTPYVVTKSFADPIEVEPEFLRQATKFVWLVLYDLYNKEFEKDATEKMPYWFVPLNDWKNPVFQDDLFFLIDLNTLTRCATQEETAWRGDLPNEFFKDKFLIDRYHGGRRYFAMEVDEAMRPDDPVPIQAVQDRKRAVSVFDYSNSKFGTTRGDLELEKDPNGHVVKAYKMLHRRNMLAKPKTSEVKNFGLENLAWVCPQLLKISMITPRLVTMLLAYPAIIHRLEDYMIALEAADIAGAKLDAGLALAAVTKDSDNSDEHRDEAINQRFGMGDNYERLEFIGDCFLKMATSISVYVLMPDDDECEFHAARMLMICNQTLFTRAKELRLYEYVRTQEFSRRTWYPPNIKLIRGKGAGKEGPQPIHHLADKSIADVSEALIGAAFVQYDKPGEEWEARQWEPAVRVVTRLVDNAKHNFQNWTDYMAAYNLPEYQTGALSAVHHDLVAKVYKEHPYRFQYPRLLRSAFTHPSKPSGWDKIPSYQRLEFLGDALLDMASVRHLFYEYPDRDPQWLTEHKMAMVSNRFLGALCVKLGFYAHMRHSQATVGAQVVQWVAEATDAEAAARGAVDYWVGISQPPKCLPDIVEAYIGAMFIDCGFSFEPIQRFFEMHIKPFFVDMRIYDTFANNHPVIQIYNVLTVNFGCRDFAVLADELPSGDVKAAPKVVAGLIIHNRVVAFSTGSSSRYAKLRACHKGLESLEGVFRPDYRRLYGCTCKADDEEVPEISGIGTAI